MSLPAWRSLSPQDQQIFRDAARESNHFMRTQWAALEERSRQDAAAAGILVNKDFDRSPFVAHLTSIANISRLVGRSGAGYTPGPFFGDTP